MKATLEFNLPEEREEYELMSSAGKLHSALWDLSQWIREKDKYEGAETVTLELLRDVFWETLKEYGIDL